MSVFVGRHGAMKPAGSERDMAANIDACQLIGKSPLAIAEVASNRVLLAQGAF